MQATILNTLETVMIVTVEVGEMENKIKKRFLHNCVKSFDPNVVLLLRITDMKNPATCTIW